MGGGSSLIVHKAGKAYPLTTKPGDAYDNQVAYFVDCVREVSRLHTGAPEQARLAVAMAAPAPVHSLGCPRRVPRPQVGGLALRSTRGPSTPAKRS